MFATITLLSGAIISFVLTAPYIPPRGWDAPIGTPVGVGFDPAAACFFDADGVTAVHRTDRPEVRRPDRAEEMGDRQTRERSVL